MNWTCEHTEQRLSDYIDQALHVNDRRAFDAHVNSCPNCTALVSRVSRLVTRMQLMEDVAPPPRLALNILDRTIGPRETAKGWSGFLHGFKSLLSPRMAYGFLSAGVTLMVLLSASGFSWRKPKLADLAPANIYRNADRQVHLVYAQSTRFVSGLRVVYEIQTRLREENEIPAGQEAAPKPAPQKAPGSSDGSKPSLPKQQNRANDLGSRLRVFTACELSPSLERIAELDLPLITSIAGRRTR